MRSQINLAKVQIGDLLEAMKEVDHDNETTVKEMVAKAKKEAGKLFF